MTAFIELYTNTCCCLCDNRLGPWNSNVIRYCPGQCRWCWCRENIAFCATLRNVGALNPLQIFWQIFRVELNRVIFLKKKKGITYFHLMKHKSLIPDIKWTSINIPETRYQRSNSINIEHFLHLSSGTSVSTIFADHFFHWTVSFFPFLLVLLAIAFHFFTSHFDVLFSAFAVPKLLCFEYLFTHSFFLSRLFIKPAVFLLFLLFPFSLQNFILGGILLNFVPVTLKTFDIE